MTIVERPEAENFLFKEAALLDAWKLEEWANLFTDDGSYLVPATDTPDGDPATSLFLIFDDRHRLGERAKRLLKKGAHVEYPHSRTRRLIGNVQVLETQNGVAEVACNFVVYRSKREITDVYPGHARYELLRDTANALRIRKKTATLDLEALRPQGKLSIIL
jgi:p-cumate 2,3-dioxygenase beta subunit